jgi:ferritin
MKTGELQKWDMQMFVTEARKLSKDPKFYSNEAVEVNWMGIEEILERCKEKDKIIQNICNRLKIWIGLDSFSLS